MWSTLGKMRKLESNHWEKVVEWWKKKTHVMHHDNGYFIHTYLLTTLSSLSRDTNYQTGSSTIHLLEKTESRDKIGKSRKNPLEN